MADSWLEIDEDHKIKILWFFAEDNGDESGAALGEGIQWDNPSEKEPEDIEHYVASVAAREFATDESKNTDDGLEFETLAKAKKALAAANAALKANKSGSTIVVKPKTASIEFELLFDIEGKQPICADTTRSLYCKLYRFYSVVDHHCGYLCCSLKSKGHQVIPNRKCPLHGGK